LQDALGITRDDTDPDLLKVKNQLARLHLLKGEFDSAKQYTDEVITTSGSNVDAQFTLGQIYLQKKDGLNAVSAFRTVVAERPEAVKGHLFLAQAHLLNKERKLVKDVLVNGIEANPTAAPLHRALARLYLANKDYPAAEKQLRLIVEQHPKDARARGDLADFLFARQRRDEAVKIYENMVVEQPNVPAGYLKLAAIFKSQKKPLAALDILEKGYAAIPQAVPLLTTLIKSYLAGGKADLAVDLVRKRIEADEKDFVAQNLLGEIYQSKKQYGKAQHAFEEVIAINPQWPVPHNNLARTYLLQGKKDEAVINLKTALEKNPQNGAAYMTLGGLYLDDGQKAKAMEIYERAINANPNLWGAANNLAYLLSNEGNGEEDLDRAYELAKKAVQLKPEEATAIDTLGWVHYLRGETDMAIAELEKAFEQAPDSPAIHYHLGLSLAKANRLDEAREMLELAVSKDDFDEREAAEKALQAL
jgi:tetratricopeptide (TPR) repeat protein